jgi:hypothetical protein
LFGRQVTFSEILNEAREWLALGGWISTLVLHIEFNARLFPSLLV